MPIGLEKNCKNCGQEGKGRNTKICNSCSGISIPSKWIPKQNANDQPDKKFSVPAIGWFGRSIQGTFTLKSEYPEPDESKWPPKAKLSKGVLNIDALTKDLEFAGTLGEITSDGERGYICTHCGKTVTQAHHIKPECYKVIYKGQTFYMEKHICDDCMKEFEKKKE